VHQIAYLAERQLALILNPVSNGGRPPLLTPTPGPCSGLAGVQIAASSLVSRMRQLAYPSSLTSLPTNLNNQDIVPNALSGATVVAELADLAETVVGSLALAATQLGHLDGVAHPAGSLLAELADVVPSITVDRPLHGEVRDCWAFARRHAHFRLPPAGACAV
jgi:histidine ammonia-lyase